MENPTLGHEGEQNRLEQLREVLAQVVDSAIYDGLLSEDIAQELQDMVKIVNSYDR